MHHPAPQRAPEYLPQENEWSKPASRVSIRRHARKCSVCKHPDRYAIEYDYLRWRSPERISREFNVHYSAVYRHAQATGLLARRQAGLRATLENFIEHSESVRVTAASVVAAVRLYAQMNDAGELIAPPKTYVVQHQANGRFAGQCPPSVASSTVATHLPAASPQGQAQAQTQAQAPQTKNPPSNRKLAFTAPHINPSDSAKKAPLIANFEPSPRKHKRPQKARR